jgi:hypothetical protein
VTMQRLLEAAVVQVAAMVAAVLLQALLLLPAVQAPVLWCHHSCTSHWC